MHRETGSYLFMVIATCQRKLEPFLVLHIVVNYYTISIFEIEIQRHYIGSLCVVVLLFSSCRRPCLKIQFGIYSISGLKFKLNPHNHTSYVWRIANWFSTRKCIAVIHVCRTSPPVSRDPPTFQSQWVHLLLHCSSVLFVSGARTTKMSPKLFHLETFNRDNFMEIA